MSDIEKIRESRKAARESLLSEVRNTRANEDIADALEGIRQDATRLTTQVAELLQTLATIQRSMKH
jgi:hypothetical protein